MYSWIKADALNALRMGTALLAVVALPVAGLAEARAPKAPENILPPSVATPAPAAPAAPVPAPVASPSPVPAPKSAVTAVIPPAPLPDPVMQWTLGDARALLGVIENIGEEGLIPADYQLTALRAAVNGKTGPELDVLASKSFVWLAEDLRDGRTPVTARVQWFALDPDADANPTAALMTRALANHDVAGVLASLAPTHPDFQALKAALAATPRAEAAKRAALQANMDRWRWLPHDLGVLYLMTNVPEFQLRLATNQRIVRTYRTVVGKPGRTATPQLAETVRAVVFNPTWTVPQSIVVGEGLGPRLLGNPASARRQGYKVTKAADGMITVVQQPGDSNSLGRMKIDMPNPHAIYLHDTPSKALFNAPARAYSHGCIRTDRAVELGMTMAILGADITPEQAVEYHTSMKLTRVEMTKTFPVYLTYFTTGVDINGQLANFADIYGRDAPVLASFKQARQLKTAQRTSTEAIIKLDNPL